MNRNPIELPDRCDVLVVGAGPAGSATAQILARGRRDVILIDAHTFPRDKVCGDGLIADAHRALARLGVLDAVMTEAYSSQKLSCIAPRGGRIEVPGRLAVLRRKRLDEIVCCAAIQAGARMFTPLRFMKPLRDFNGRIGGALLQCGGVAHKINASWVVLATGAQPQALIAADLCERRNPSGVALRGYVRNAAMSPVITSLEVIWHKRLSPGYGWIFPCGDGRVQHGRGNRPRPARAQVWAK
jgi:flavin-dependent dehydrogenase